MNRHTKHRLSKLLFPVIGLGLLAYFTYHILNETTDGLLENLEKELEKSKAELAKLKEDHEALKNKVSLLRLNLWTKTCSMNRSAPCLAPRAMKLWSWMTLHPRIFSNKIPAQNPRQNPIDMVCLKAYIK